MQPSLSTLCAELQLLDRAMRQRSVGATAMNEQSSRSHMVFMLQLRGANELSGQRVHAPTVVQRECQHTASCQSTASYQNQHSTTCASLHSLTSLIRMCGPGCHFCSPQL